MLGFYVTCFLFVFVVLGTLLRAGRRASTSSRCCKYLGREFLLILSTSSSESALPRLIAKMEHLGVSKPVVGITVPTGYSFNLDGTAIYLTMASLFIADAMGKPLSIGEQISLLLFMIVASKGAAGVTGAGLATLAGGLQSHRPELVDGVGLIVGIDRFMSEARALTNFAGNAVATVLIGTWTKEIDKERVAEVLAGQLPVRREDPAGRRRHRRRATRTCRSRAARRNSPRLTGVGAVGPATRPGRCPAGRRIRAVAHDGPARRRRAAAPETPGGRLLCPTRPGRPVSPPRRPGSRRPEPSEDSVAQLRHQCGGAEAGTPAAVSMVTAAERPASSAARSPSFTASIRANRVCSCDVRQRLRGQRGREHALFQAAPEHLRAGLAGPA